MIYISAFWLTGVLKLCYVLVRGRARGHGRVSPKTGDDPFSLYECTPDDPKCIYRSFNRLLIDAWHARKKMFFKMTGVLAVVTLVVQVLTEWECSFG